MVIVLKKERKNMKKSELWGIRITYIVMFVILVGVYELVKWSISSLIGSSWVSPIILGLIFVLGLIYVDLHADDLDDGEDILERPYNYIVIDIQNKITKFNSQIIIERGDELTEEALSEIEKEYEIVNILPAYILEADLDDSDVNKIKEMIEK